MSWQDQAELTAEDIRTLFIFGEVTVGEVKITLASGAIQSAIQTVVEMSTYSKGEADTDNRKWSDDQ